MAVITKVSQQALLAELHQRFDKLCNLLQGRELQNATEGCKRGHWTHPENLQFIDAFQVHLAARDFETILAELKKVK